MRGGLLEEDDNVLEYDPLDESNRVYSRTSLYRNFAGNRTRAEIRRANPSAFVYHDASNDHEESLSDRQMYENRRERLIWHYVAMIKNRTLQFGFR